jgi:hypothetical protein
VNETTRIKLTYLRRKDERSLRAKHKVTTYIRDPDGVNGQASQSDVNSFGS